VGDYLEYFDGQILLPVSEEQFQHVQNLAQELLAQNIRAVVDQAPRILLASLI
jgi:hypothetical protein